MPGPTRSTRTSFVLVAEAALVAAALLAPARALAATESYTIDPDHSAVGFKILETYIARQWPVYWPLFLGAAVIAVIVLLPKGFVGLVEGRAWRRRLAVHK